MISGENAVGDSFRPPTGGRHFSAHGKPTFEWRIPMSNDSESQHDYT